MKKNENMFSLLMSDDEEEEQETVDDKPVQAPKTCSHSKYPTFTITKGSCQPIFHADKGFLSKMSIFYGRCYLCFSVGHSQKWCSLKFCPRCGQFGHSAVTCVSSQPITWRRKLRYITKKESKDKVVQSVLRQLVETIIRKHEVRR